MADSMIDPCLADNKQYANGKPVHKPAYRVRSRSSRASAWHGRSLHGRAARRGGSISQS